jgi:threonine dehydratase
VGFEGDTGDRRTLAAYLKRVGYRYWEETENPAYQLFLR